MRMAAEPGPESPSARADGSGPFEADAPDQPPGMAAGPGHRGKYARAERERRFLLAAPPAAAEVLAARRITDRYLTGTRLRLRHSQRLDTGELELKFTQKVPAGTPGPVQCWITNTYLSPSEYDLLATLPAVTLTKTRFTVPPLGIDVFEGELHGLILAEAEFASDRDYQTFTPPPRCIHEITTDPRFTGGRLAHTSRQELLAWLSDYNLTPG
jgi:CYTH domain-containing protein